MLAIFLISYHLALMLLFGKKKYNKLFAVKRKVLKKLSRRNYYY